PRDPNSFPTRRSSDLAVPVLVPDVHLQVVAAQQRLPGLGRQLRPRRVHPEPEGLAEGLDQPLEVVADVPAAPRRDRALRERLRRSEEHTSELQSPYEL